MNYSEEEKRMLREMIENSDTGVIAPSSYFIQVPNSFIRNENLSVTEKMMYMYILGFGFDRRGVYPSQTRMMKELGLSRPTIIKTLKSLEEKGGLYIINRYYKNKKEKTTNLYYLCEIDSSTGDFNKKYLDIVKALYPEKKIYI